MLFEFKIQLDVFKPLVRFLYFHWLDMEKMFSLF